MPIIYEYFGISLHFYCNERTVCVNAESGNMGGTFGKYESRAELVVQDDVVVEAEIFPAPYRTPLPFDMMENFKKVLGSYPQEIYQKWKSFFEDFQELELEKFPRRIQSDPSIPITDRTFELLPLSPLPISVVGVRGYGYGFEFTFSDKQSRKVDFEPFMRASKHPGIRKYLDDWNLWDYETDLIQCGYLQWIRNDISFSMQDIYTGILSGENF